MFDFYFIYAYDLGTLPNWLSSIGHLTLAVCGILGYTLAKRTFNVAGGTLATAKDNLESVRISQRFQIQMNIISAENDLREKESRYLRIAEEHNEMSNLSISEKNKKGNMDWDNIINRKNEDLNFSLENYCSSANKVAILIQEVGKTGIFPNRNWSGEYKEMFERVLTSAEEIEELTENMLTNVSQLVNDWN